MPLFDFRQAVSEHLRKSGKAVSIRKRGRPCNQSRDGTPISFTGHGSPASSNPGTPSTNSPSKIRTVPVRHQELPLNSVRTDKRDHWPNG